MHYAERNGTERNGTERNSTIPPLWMCDKPSIAGDETFVDGIVHPFIGRGHGVDGFGRAYGATAVNATMSPTTRTSPSG